MVTRHFATELKLRKLCLHTKSLVDDFFCNKNSLLNLRFIAWLIVKGQFAIFVDAENYTIILRIVIERKLELYAQIKQSVAFYSTSCDS